MLTAPTRSSSSNNAISYVLLAGDYVYKIKKPVRFAFLDYSTLEKRHHFCHEEIRLNRRLAPAVYLDVLAVVRDGERFSLGEFPGREGKIVEYAVKMRRLPEGIPRSTHPRRKSSAATFRSYRDEAGAFLRRGVLRSSLALRICRGDSCKSGKKLERSAHDVFELLRVHRRRRCSLRRVGRDRSSTSCSSSGFETELKPWSPPTSPASSSPAPDCARPRLADRDLARAAIRWRRWPPPPQRRWRPSG